MLVGERFELRDNPLELPERGVREGWYIPARVRTFETPLSSLSLHSHSRLWEKRAHRIANAPSVLCPSLSPHCPMFAGVGNRQRVRRRSINEWNTHIVVLYQDGYRAYDRLQWKE